MHHRPQAFDTPVNELLINYFRQKGKWYNNDALEYCYRLCCQIYAGCEKGILLSIGVMPISRK